MIVLRNPKDGSMVCVESADGHKGWEKLEERDGLPPEHSNWVDGRGWVQDAAHKAAFEEEARLNCMSPTARHAEAIERAKADIARALQSAGVVTAAQAKAIVASKPQS